MIDKNIFNVPLHFLKNYISIYLKSFACTALYYVKYSYVQQIISKTLFYLFMGLKQELLIKVKDDPRVMATKGYYKFPSASHWNSPSDSVGYQTQDIVEKIAAL